MTLTCDPLRANPGASVARKESVFSMPTIPRLGTFKRTCSFGRMCLKEKEMMVYFYASSGTYYMY